MSDIPIIMTQAGAQPTPPKTLLANLISSVSQKVPDYTANLPAGLITDLASTSVGALALIDQMRVDLINSCSPYGANIPLLTELGNIYGVPVGTGTNTSVDVTFTGLPGFAIPKGFVISDGNNQYAVVNDVMIPESGQTDPVYCLAISEGSWAVPAGSVNQIITSVPASQPVTCTNQTAGLPGTLDPTYSTYRSRVMQAGMRGVQGTPDCLRDELQDVTGVQANLISYRQASLGEWVVTVGGGDPFQVAYAIYKAIPDISVLTNAVTNPSGAAVDARSVEITVYPDTYQIPYVVPTSQNVLILITWGTASTGFVDPDGMAKASQQSIADYVNSIAVGQPINTYIIQEIFLTAVADLVPQSLLSLIDVQVGINGTIVTPDTDSSLVYGDTYGYFSTSASQIQVQQNGSTTG
ncbi:baseplate J/gp47 family protein [Trabulsiella odontotermitis]|uniref:baseplate J/gp47 family protein n=1 Tax=Trabulsiella odontotermitis TaxID=379893 RepID=UPI003ACC92A9